MWEERVKPLWPSKERIGCSFGIVPTSYILTTPFYNNAVSWIAYILQDDIPHRLRPDGFLMGRYRIYAADWKKLPIPKMNTRVLYCGHPKQERPFDFDMWRIVGEGWSGETEATRLNTFTVYAPDKRSPLREILVQEHYPIALAPGRQCLQKTFQWMSWMSLRHITQKSRGRKPVRR